MKEEIIYLKNMGSPRDILLVRNELEQLGVRVKEIELGTASFMSSGDLDWKGMEKALQNLGFRIIQKEEKEFSEQVRRLLEMYLDQLCQKNDQVAPLMSKFLELNMGISYARLSKRFRRIEERTIENFLIFLKVGKIKELVISTDWSMEKIAQCLNYSSSRSLARVFREATGFSVYDLKKTGRVAYRRSTELKGC